MKLEDIPAIVNELAEFGYSQKRNQRAIAAITLLAARFESLTLLYEARGTAIKTLQRNNVDLAARLKASLDERNRLNERLRAPLIKEAFISTYQGPKDDADKT